MAGLYGQDPRVVDQEWDELWINRILLVKEAERQASLARTKQKIDDSTKE